MTDPSFVVFGAYFADLVIQYLDGSLTQQGMTHKLVEGKQIAAWLFSKLGVAGTNAIKIGVVPIVATFVDFYSGWPGAANATLAAVTLYPVIRNVLLLRKNKIKISIF